MKLGFIGLGSMGLPMAVNLVNSGYELKVHTRSRNAEFNPLLAKANSSDSPREVSRSVDALLLCLSDSKAVEEVLFGPNGSLDSLTCGSYVLDFSTISYEKAIQFSKKLAKKNVYYIDCPVTGGSEGAVNGSLTILVGGRKSALEKFDPIYQALGKRICYFGKVGDAQKVKAVNQVLVAGTYAAVAEGLALAEAHQLPLEDVISCLSTGAGSSWALINRSKNMLNNEYPLGFKLKLHHKDLVIAEELASIVNLNIPITNLVKSIEGYLISKGYGEQDISVLRKFFKQI
tara:strand:+ start:400 stop:1263 length:864 start_codon:yes stop_codon:yes gene_type:complete